MSKHPVTSLVILVMSVAAVVLLVLGLSSNLTTEALVRHASLSSSTDAISAKKDIGQRGTSAEPFVHILTNGSPLQIRGGAMTFRSYNQLNCNTPITSCYVSIGSTSTPIILAGVFIPGTTTVADLSFVANSVPWQLNLVSRDGSSGMSVCSNVASGSCSVKASAKPTGQAFLIPYSGGKFYPFATATGPQGIDDVPNSNNVRYLTPDKSKCADEDICEHISDIQLIIGNGTDSPPAAGIYHCANGDCAIYIGQQPS